MSYYRATNGTITTVTPPEVPYDGSRKVRLLPPPVPVTWRIGERPRATASIALL